MEQSLLMILTLGFLTQLCGAIYFVYRLGNEYLNFPEEHEDSNILQDIKKILGKFPLITQLFVSGVLIVLASEILIVLI